MKNVPHIAAVASLLGEPARSEMLTALLAARALTASELATVAGVTKQTASSHLAKLAAAKLVAVESQGRHRYFRLADPDVARLLEGLMGVAERTGARRPRPGPREPRLRRARACYGHLAGELGVFAYDALRRRRLVRETGARVDLTAAGRAFFMDLGVAVDKLGRRRPLCRACLDWSERRHHLAGALGSAFLARIEQLRWARREEGSRIVTFTPRGEAAFRAALA
jgi:DNA-binding transcriptional ArsR family regulator